MAKKEIDLAFLFPTFKTIELPSKGKFYQKNPALVNGEVKLRKMAAPEELIIDTINENTFYSSWCDIIRACTGNTIDARDLTFSDFIYILFALRSMSYGDRYVINTKCGSCGKETKANMSIGQFEPTFLEKEVVEPFEITLPESKIVLEMTYPRMRTIIESTRRTYSELKIKGKKISSDVTTRAICTTEMRLPNEDSDIIHNTEEEFPILVDVFSRIPANDTLEIKKTWNKYDHGLIEPILVKCDKCGNLFKEWPVITPDMFRPDTREQGTSEETN